MGMKISNRYLETVQTYLEWCWTTTPASGSFQEASAPRPKIGVSHDGLSATEALCVWESTGKSCQVIPEQEELLNRYVYGKGQRDWWTKEIGWWNKNAFYVAEEFIRFLHPLNFIELFGREPLTNLVRYCHDNQYAAWEFKLDLWAQCFVERNNMAYFERDDRHSALRNAWRVMVVKYLDPFSYRIRRMFNEAT